MSNKKQHIIVGQTSPTSTPTLDLDGYTRLSVQTIITNASGLTGSIILQVSNDHKAWVNVQDTEVYISGNTVHLFDMETGAGFARLLITVLTGQADFEADWILK